ncbi:phage integrase SAM-like domain-containing protein [Microbulbifer sp. SA54]|uniref:phage integrase SAM-like domain-containing protein n=1 Tax=Microbulbifer sp. SA54 TaxID=3401577 RepID=UPI003AAC2E80
MSPKNPFTPAALAQKNRPAPKHTLPSNAPEDIKARQRRKKLEDFNDKSFSVKNQTSGRPFIDDFSPLALRFPANKALIQQLLLGAELHVGKRIVAYQTHQDTYYVIKEFIEFVNSNEPKNKSVINIGDIDWQLCLHFRAFLIRTYPARTVNRKRFGALKNIIQKTQKKIQ